jgi:hypothetical protein
LTDLRKGPPSDTAAILTEMYLHAELLGDLMLDAMVDACPPGTLEALMTTELLDKLDAFPAFRERRVRDRIAGQAATLQQFFEIRGDVLSEHAVQQIATCTEPITMQKWLERAFRGETAAEIFGAE